MTDAKNTIGIQNRAHAGGWLKTTENGGYAIANISLFASLIKSKDATIATNENLEYQSGAD